MHDVGRYVRQQNSILVTFHFNDLIDDPYVITTGQVPLLLPSTRVFSVETHDLSSHYSRSPYPGDAANANAPKRDNDDDHQVA